MRILVTGSSGQVVRSIIDRAGSSDEIVALGRPHLDLAGEPSDIVAAVTSARPDAIISSAAYTAVDKAESELELAFATNARGPGAIAAAARELSIPLLHLSTDYVFDGSAGRPYTEQDATGPTTVYGASKLAGEEAVLGGHDNSAVLRTAWVYGPFGANFVKTMLRVAQTRDEVRVVADQLGNPTSALDIADTVLAVVRNLSERNDPDLRGLFHMSGSGEASWAEFAKAIFDSSADTGGPTASVTPITTADYPTPAKRPANSRLDCSKLERVHGRRLPDWRSSLPPVVSAIVAEMARTEEQR